MINYIKWILGGLTCYKSLHLFSFFVIQSQNDWKTSFNIKCIVEGLSKKLFITNFYRMKNEICNRNK